MVLIHRYVSCSMVRPYTGHDTNAGPWFLIFRHNFFYLDTVTKRCIIKHIKSSKSEKNQREGLMYLHILPAFQMFLRDCFPQQRCVSPSKFQISVSARWVRSQSVTTLPGLAGFCVHTVFSKAYHIFSFS